MTIVDSWRFALIEVYEANLPTGIKDCQRAAEF
jgi:hypothetical protein